MFWPFIEAHGRLVYCPLADFGGQGLREGQDIYAKAIVAEPVTGHEPLRNAAQVRGKIVVLQRGGCDFVTKVLIAQRAGAVAALVANVCTDDRDEAFVMDAGSLRRHPSATVEEIRIPAMMMPYNLATVVFKEIRMAFLDRHDYTLTIKLLGAQTAAWVLEQREHAAWQVLDEQRREQHRQQRDRNQQEAAKLLRSRVGGIGSSSRASSHGSPTKASSVKASRPRWSNGDHGRRATRSDWGATSFHGDTFAEPVELSRDSDKTRSSNNSSEDGDVCKGLEANRTFNVAARPDCNNQEEELSSSTLHPWCPMTTALVIIDVQNHFILKDSRGKSPAFDHYALENVLLPNLQDVLLASRAAEGVEIIYSVVESATLDGRERSQAYKHAGIHVTRSGFGARVPNLIAPDEDHDFVLPRPGIK